LELKKSRWFNRDVFFWTLFDFGNSSFATIVVSLVYAVYFKSVVAINEPAADFYWSSSINISMIIVAVLSPVLGASADYFAIKKIYLLIFTLLCVISSGLLHIVAEGMIFWGMTIFILANIGFQAGMGFYDAFLKEISAEENYNKVSSAGYAVGYLGSLFSLFIVLLFKNEPRLTFPACAVLFFTFSMPLFLFIKEKKAVIVRTETRAIDFLRIGLIRVTGTLKHIKDYKNLRNFLLSYFLYIDGVNTVIFFSAIYANSTLSFTIAELVLFFVIVQITALIGSFLFGYLADKAGTKRILGITLIGWIVLTIMVFFSQDKLTFIVIGGLAGFFLGSSQALSRSLFSLLVPDEKKTEFFGFYSLFEKTSTILGPFTFGMISWLTGNQRFAVLSIAIFFITGYLLLRKVKEPEAAGIQ
jgi:UMF1 family MFS transporter